MDSVLNECVLIMEMERKYASNMHVYFIYSIQWFKQE